MKHGSKENKQNKQHDIERHKKRKTLEYELAILNYIKSIFIYSKLKTK